MKKKLLLLVLLLAFVASFVSSGSSQAGPSAPVCARWSWAGDVGRDQTIYGPYNYWVRLIYSRGGSNGGGTYAGFVPGGNSDLRYYPVSNLTVYAVGGYQRPFFNSGPYGAISVQLYADNC